MNDRSALTLDPEALGSPRAFDAAATAALAGEAHPEQTLKGADATVTARTLPRLTLGDAIVGEEASHDLQLRRILGEGGMGVVWLAHQASLGRDVAIKRIRDEAPPGADRALVREGRIMGALEHPNILPVHALGLDADGVPVLVMKRVEGVAWRALLLDPDHPGWGDRGGDPLERNLLVLVAVCRAVAFAHEHGVLHRDIKPDNVLVGRFGEVWLTDWGVAARREELGERRLVVGTPAYMPPELADPALPLDERADVALLGACLHEVLTRRPPNAGAGLAEVLRAAHAAEPAEYPGAVPALAALARRARARRPEDRPPSADALRQELEFYLRTRRTRVLLDEATARIAELRTATGAAADALFTEVRFALRQASDDHPEARERWREALALGVGHHLVRGDVEGAEALLAELAALGDGAPALRERLAEARRIREELTRLRVDADHTTSAGPRAVGLTTATVVFAVICVAILARYPEPTHAITVGALVSTWSIVLGGYAMLGRRIVYNAANRRLLGILIGTFVLELANRLLAWRFHGPLAQMFALDLAIMASGAAAATMYLGLRTYVVTALCLVGAGMVAAFPAHGLQIFAVTTLGALLILSWHGITLWLSTRARPG